MKCKCIKPYAIQHDDYGFVLENTHQILSNTDEPYVSLLQITESFLIDDVKILGWSYVIQVDSRSKRKFMEYDDIMVNEKCTSLQ